MPCSVVSEGAVWSEAWPACSHRRINWWPARGWAVQAEHVDALDAELAELRPRSTQLELQNASMRSTLRRSARQESVRRGEESWLREELERSHSEEQASEVGQQRPKA
jgi:hypothetical protein